MGPAASTSPGAASCIARISNPPPTVSPLLRAVTAAALLVAACGGDDGPVDDLGADTRRARCVRAVDRAVELQVDPAAPDRAAHLAAMKAAVGDRFLRQCEDGGDDVALDCMTRAKTSAELAACTPATATAEVTP